MNYGGAELDYNTPILHHDRAGSTATYVLPDDRLTDKQRERYFYDLLPGDAVEITAHVLENYPAVYDEAVHATARANRLAALTAKENAA